jgi:hypothetical protein
MPNSRTGHFVQVFKPIAANDWHLPKPRSKNQRGLHPNYVEVEGRATSRTVTEWPYWAEDGWFYISRELPRKRAVKFARAYRNAGFASRVVFKGHTDERVVTDQFDPR